RVVLDLGAGTGRLTRALRRRYPAALTIALDLAPGMLRVAGRRQGWWRRFARVCGDAQRLPLADASVDLVFSNLMLPWCDPAAAFAEVQRVLRPQGLLAFSTLGPQTLAELRAAWAAADRFSHVHRFADVQEVGMALMRSRLAEPVLDVDRLRRTTPDACALMRGLKSLGAHNVSAGRPRSLLGRTRLERVRQAYEALRGPDGLPVTYEIIYGVSWGSAARAALAHEAQVAVASIRRAGPRR
ncbi:MAG: methyltransferase domain-containing protein, partial [Gammaproteobacteria bacterium]|nr:methyltransferase domain-containing protein [Gammaproteobacteria bacterium]